METDSEIPLSLLSIAFFSIYLFTSALQCSSRLHSPLVTTSTNTSLLNFEQLISRIKYLPIMGLSVSGSFLAIALVNGVWAGLASGLDRAWGRLIG